jgi:hypothetical protein
MTITFEKLLEILKSANSDHFALTHQNYESIFDKKELTTFIVDDALKISNGFTTYIFRKEDNQSIPIINNDAIIYLRHFHKRGTRQYETCTDQYGGEYVTEIQKTLETYDLVEYKLSILVKQPFT